MASKPLPRWYAYIGVGVLLALTIVFFQLEGPINRWCAYVGSGGVLLLTLVLLPAKIKAALVTLVPPSWMSVSHAPVGWFGYFYLYEQGYLFLGILCLAFSGALDKLDGMGGRAYDWLVGKPLRDLRFWTQMNHSGTTPMGEVVDSLWDKLTVGPMFVDICVRFLRTVGNYADTTVRWLIYIAVIQIVLMLLADIFGQMLRLDTFRKLRHKDAKDNKAGWAGKYKALGQWLWLIFLPPLDHGWVTDGLVGYLIFLNGFLFATLVLAVLSVVGKIRPLQEAWTSHLETT